MAFLGDGMLWPNCGEALYRKSELEADSGEGLSSMVDGVLCEEAFVDVAGNAAAWSDE